MLLADLPATLMRSLLGSVRMQLLVAGGAALVAAVCLGVLLGGGPAVVVGAAWWLLATSSVTIAAACAAAGGAVQRSELLDLMARGVVQELCLAGPVAVIVALTGLAATVHPLLGLLLVPVAFIACALLAGPAALVPGAIAAGDRAWLPRRSIAVARAMPWRLAGIVIIGVMAVALVLLPAVLGGLLLTAVLGPLGFVGYGLGASIGTPIVGAASVQLWVRLGGRVELPAAADRTGGQQPREVAPTWLPGPSWHATFDASGMWGTWLQMPTAGQVAVQAAVPSGCVMRVLLHGPAGAWVDCGMLPVPGPAPLVVSLEGGASWLQLQAADPTIDLAVDVTLLVPAAAAASAA